MNFVKRMASAQNLFTLIMLALVVSLIATGNAVAAVLIAPAVAADIEQLATEFASAKSAFDTKRGELDSQYTELKGRMEKGETISLSLKESIDKALTSFSGLKAEFDEVQQKMAGGNESANETKTWGEAFVNGQNFKSASEGGTLSARHGVVRQEVKAVTSTAAGGLIRSQRETEVTNLLRERRVIRDLLTTIPVNTSSVDYAIQSTRTNNAAPVAESAVKPYSDYTWGSATAVIRTLAHLAKITRQAMDDAPRLIGEIDSEMRYGLGFVEERQILYGTGVGQNLLGIIPQATAFARPAGFGQLTGATRIDVLRVAMLQNSLALLPADGIVMHEMDWALIELSKTSDGAYLFANPQGTVGQRMWGLPVVATPAMVAGDFLVGSFRMGATVYDRMAVEVLISTENVDDFEKNLATMRAEERIGLAVKRPQAFTKGTFSTGITALTAV